MTPRSVTLISSEEKVAVIQEIAEWLRTNIGPGGRYNHHKIDSYQWTYSFNTRTRAWLFTFKEMKQAVMFKLTWGGA